LLVEGFEFAGCIVPLSIDNIAPVLQGATIKELSTLVKAPKIVFVSAFDREGLIMAPFSASLARIPLGCGE
jgi:hypothetical protein